VVGDHWSTNVPSYHESENGEYKLQKRIIYIYIYIKKKKEDATNVWEKGLSDCIAEMQSLACIFG